MSEYKAPTKPPGDFRETYAAWPPMVQSLWRMWVAEVALDLCDLVRAVGLEHGEPVAWAQVVQSWLTGGYAMIEVEASLRGRLLVWNGYGRRYERLARITPEALSRLAEELAKGQLSQSSPTGA